MHAVQLEAAELEHGKIVRPDVRDAVKERRADVTAEMHGVSLRTQKLRRDGRSRGLAVAAGDGKDAAGAEIAERLHLGGEDRAVLRSLTQLRHNGQHARRAEDHIKVQMLEIVRAEGKSRALRRGLIPCCAELRAFAPVAHGHVTAVLQQHTHERLIAHAKTDDADALAAQVVNIIRKGHADTPFEKLRIIQSDYTAHLTRLQENKSPQRLTYCGRMCKIVGRVSRTAAGTSRKAVREESPGSTGQG